MVLRLLKIFSIGFKIMTIPSIKIEASAFIAVFESINALTHCHPYLAENDKTPSWDGFIYIYDSDNLKKENLKGRLPAQIKGHLCDDLSKETITFNVNVVDLKNYFNDGGIIFFVVYIDDNDKRQIYYNDLTPVKLQPILEKAENQETVSVPFKKFPSDKQEREIILFNCLENCSRQKSFTKGKFQSLAELEKEGKIEGLNIFAPSPPGTDMKTALFKGDVYLYAKVEGVATPIPLDEGPRRVVNLTNIIPLNVSVNNVVYYESVKIIESPEGVEYEFGNTFKMTRDDKGSGYLTYKSSSMLSNYVRDQEFFLNAIKCGSFSFGGNDIKIENETEEDISNTENDLFWFKELVKLLDFLNCKKDIDIKQLKESDWESIKLLCSILLYKNRFKYQIEIGEWIEASIANLSFILLVKKDENEKETYYLSNVFEDNAFVPCGKDRIPCFAFLQTEDFLKFDNLKCELFLPALKKLDESPFILNMANSFLAELIKAYDKDNQRSDILQSASSISEWLLSTSDEKVPRAIKILNHLQIEKRKGQLTEDQKKELYLLIENTDSTEYILTGAYLLLDNQQLAELHFDKIEKQLQEKFRQQPIFYFWQEK